MCRLIKEIFNLGWLIFWVTYPALDKEIKLKLYINFSSIVVYLSGNLQTVDLCNASQSHLLMWVNHLHHSRIRFAVFLFCALVFARFDIFLFRKISYLFCLWPRRFQKNSIPRWQTILKCKQTHEKLLHRCVYFPVIIVLS